MSCVQEIPINIKKLQVELVETRREQVSQFNQIVEQINQHMKTFQEDPAATQSPDHIDEICHFCYTKALYMFITYRTYLILQAVLCTKVLLLGS